MRNINWSNVPDATDFPRVTPGGYIVRIVKVEDEEDREFLRIYYDFIEGDLKGYYGDLYKSKGFWGGTFIRSYKEKALPFFKGFKTAVEESNPGFTFQNDPQSLVAKYVGVVLGEEEYTANDGKIKTRIYVDKTMSGQRIRTNDFKVPALKKLDNGSGQGPFNALSEKVADVFPDDRNDPFAKVPENALLREKPQAQQGDLFAGRYASNADDDDDLPF